MATKTPTRHETVVQFLSALAGPGARPRYLELRYRREDGNGMGQVFDRPDRVRGLATRAVMLGRRTDVYVGCAPRDRRFGGRDAVSQGHALWVDCDGDASVEALHAFDPAPAIVVASGTGSNCHAYWLLADPLPRDDVERGNRRLAHALGADAASADAARILRVPCTWAHKRQPPTAVEAITLDVHRHFGADDVIGSLADPPATKCAGPPLLARDGDDPLQSIAPEVYVRRLLGVDVPRHRKVTCPFHEDRHPSLHVYDSPERGWYCYGRCRRGGTIYDLAAPLYGYAARGGEFVRLRAELLRLFGLEAAS